MPRRKSNRTAGRASVATPTRMPIIAPPMKQLHASAYVRAKNFRRELKQQRISSKRQSVFVGHAIRGPEIGAGVPDAIESGRTSSNAFFQEEYLEFLREAGVEFDPK